MTMENRPKTSSKGYFFVYLALGLILLLLISLFLMKSVGENGKQQKIILIDQGFTLDRTGELELEKHSSGEAISFEAKRLTPGISKLILSCDQDLKDKQEIVLSVEKQPFTLLFSDFETDS
ncbi:hypothetical protein KKC60_04025, partial [Patescibacteria group bacterium]|nr:hypothetical protein [Patescibacteria group bacterium]